MNSRFPQTGRAQSAPWHAQPKRVAAINAAREALARRAFPEAMAALRPLLDAKRTDPEALFLAGFACEGLRRIGDAKRFARRSLANMEHPETLLLLARLERQTGDTEEAIRMADRAAAKPRAGDSPHIVKGGALEEAGRFDEALAVLEPLADKARSTGRWENALRFEWSKVLVQFKRYDEAINLIDETLNLPSLPDVLRKIQLHLKAKACDRSRRFEDAFEAAGAANQIEFLEFDPDLYERQVSELIRIWSSDTISAFPRAACESELPVFVAGMPRSGTSLIDQIIDAHPRAAGVGELATIENFARRLSQAWNPDKPPPDCFGPLTEKKWTKAANDYAREIRRAAPHGAERVVNKALGNNKLVGLISRLFPRTRIIHAIRDPRDVAVSCYMGGFNNRLHPWTTRLDWVAKAWEQSMRMMDHWKSVLDVPILDVHYERLVHDPDAEFPRIIDFLGLDWHEKCREFHRSRRTVRTLSYDQVNRPLYTSSAGRHANYAFALDSIAFPEYDPLADTA